MGWMTGFEPATSGSTIRRSNQLSYTHHEKEKPKGLILAKREEDPQPHEAFKFSHRRRPAFRQELS